MSDLDDLASASTGSSSPSSPGSTAGAAGKAGKSPADRWKPAQRQLEPGELPGPSTAVIVSLAVVGVLLIGGAIYIAMRAGKSGGGDAPANPPRVAGAGSNRSGPAAGPATQPATAPAATQSTTAPGTRPASRPAVARKPATKPAPPPAENFASAKDAVEVSAKVLDGDNVRVEMRNKSGKWIKGLLVYGFTKDDPTTPVGEFGTDWLRPRQTTGDDVAWPGISTLLRPGDDVPQLVVQEGEFSDPPKAPAKPSAGKRPAGEADTPADDTGVDAAR